MADISGWLRGFQRVRVTNATTLSDHLGVSDEVNEITEEMQGASSTSRMPSYQNFGHLSAPSLSETQPHLNQVEQIWHNPDPDQMAETLKVAMMTQNLFDPLHVSFNSCILHVLEAYHHMREELIDKDREIRDREERHENDIKNFRLQQLRWNEKEDEYKSGMKKLEVMLATGARGLELVTLARSRTALNGRRVSGTVKTQEIEDWRNLQDVATDEEPMMSDFAERKDSITSVGYTSERRLLNTSRNHGAYIPRQPHRAEPPIASMPSIVNTKYRNDNHNANSNTAHFGQLYWMAHSETSSTSLSGLGQEVERRAYQSSNSLGGRFSNRTSIEGSQNNMDGSKPLPKVPKSPQQTSPKDSNVEEEEEGGIHDGENLISGSVIHRRGFSFLPGDDYEKLPLGKARTPVTEQALEAHGNNMRAPSSCLSSNNEFIDRSPAKKHYRRKPILKGETRAVRESKPTIGCESEPTRSSSRTSIITAVLDQYAGSSKGSELVKDASRRPNLSRHTASNEATIAAVRAIAESGNTASKAPWI